MIGLEGIKLPYFLSKNFSSLNDFGVESFDLLSNINGDYYTFLDLDRIYYCTHF